MEYFVLLKQVPHPQAMRVDPKTGLMDRTNAPSQINNDCQHALEMALALREQSGGKVTVVSMGPPSFQASHLTALERGVDKCVLVSDRVLAGSDTYATGYALGTAVEKLKEEAGDEWMVLGGRQTTDGDTAHVPSQVAELLGTPQVTLVEKSSIQSGTVHCNRVIENGTMKLKLPLPAVLSVAPSSSPLRGRNLRATVKMQSQTDKDKRGRRIFKEDSEYYKVYSAEELGLDLEVVGLDGSPTIVAAAPNVEPVRRNYQPAEGTETKEKIESLIQIVEGWS